MSFLDRNQFEIHCFQGFSLFYCTATPCMAIFGIEWLAILLGAAFVVGITAYWEIPEFKTGARLEPWSDILQRMIGLALSILNFWWLTR